MKKPNSKRRLPKVCKVFGTALGVIAFLCIIGAIWNNIASKKESERFPPEGEMIQIHDSKMHVFITGNKKEKGQPTIVLISGLSTPSPVADFSPIWQRLNNEYTIVVLERPGYGWSEPTNLERTLGNIVKEDALALKNTGVEPPFLLVAHSIGGIEAHLFSATHPDDVQGVLLLDCMSPELYLHYGERPVPFLNKIIPPLRAIGMLRFLDTVFPNFVAGMSKSERNDFQYVDSHYYSVDRVMTRNRFGGKNMLEETKMRYKNAEEAGKASIPSNIPVTLVIPNMAESKGMPGYDEYMDFQENWISQSLNGKIVDLKGGHGIYHYDPDGVCDLIQEFMNK